MSGSAVLRILCGGIAALIAAAASQEPPGAGSPDAQLAQRYAPILYIAIPSAPCASKGEPYYPVQVEIVLGNEAIALIDGEGDEADTIMGADAAAFFRLGRTPSSTIRATLADPAAPTTATFARSRSSRRPPMLTS
jgi:hypothetical protein